MILWQLCFIAGIWTDLFIIIENDDTASSKILCAIFVFHLAYKKTNFKHFYNQLQLALKLYIKILLAPSSAFMWHFTGNSITTLLHLIQIWRISYISANFLFYYGKPISDYFEEIFFVSDPVLAAAFTQIKLSRCSAVSQLFYFPWNLKFIVESNGMKSLYVIHLQ